MLFFSILPYWYMYYYTILTVALAPSMYHLVLQFQDYISAYVMCCIVSTYNSPDSAIIDFGFRPVLLQT